MQLLFEALSYSQHVQRDRWDFAVEVASLRREGLTRSDFRWLVCQGLVEHACETRAAKGRAFQPECDLCFCRETCFVLTASGEEFAVQLLRGAAGERQPAAPIDASRPRPIADLPVFLCDVRELRFRNVVVKRYRLPSPNQEAILLAFEEEGWPRRIDDPLSPHPDHCPKQRLLDTIKSLNRHQRNPLLHFSGDGTGEAVCWECRESLFSSE